MNVTYNAARQSYIVDDFIEVFVEDFEQGRYTLKSANGDPLTKDHERKFWDFIEYAKRLDAMNPGVG